MLIFQEALHSAVSFCITGCDGKFRLDGRWIRVPAAKRHDTLGANVSKIFDEIPAHKIRRLRMSARHMVVCSRRPLASTPAT
jgi:hypothetical protein